MYSLSSISNVSNINVPILDSDEYSNDGYLGFNQDASKFHMIMLIIMCVVFLYVVLLIKYDYSRHELIII